MSAPSQTPQPIPPKNHTPQPPPPTIYRPSIYQYRCRGALYVSSSNQGPAGSLESPQCVGVETKLRKVRDLAPMTKVQAVSEFVHETHDDYYDGHDEDGYGGAPPYDAPHNNGDAWEGSAPDWHNAEDEESWSTVSCYGSTHVSLLVLQNLPPPVESPDPSSLDKQQQGEIAGVAPECTFGVSVRDIGTNRGGDTVTTLRIGPVEVSVGNHYEYEDDEEHNSQGQQGHHGQQPLEDGKGGDRLRESMFQRSNSGPGKRTPENLPPDEKTPDFTTRFLAAANKTLESMKTNARMLKDEMRDDFPNRVARSGEKIVGQCGKTLERTGKVMGDMYRMWSDDGDGDDEGRRGGGRR